MKRERIYLKEMEWTNAKANQTKRSDARGEMVPEHLRKNETLGWLYIYVYLDG